MSNANQRKTEQLGMPIGTASGRLRKMIVLNLLQQLGQDACFRCGNRIGTPEELSIEHKKPWLGNATALFWDLNNIAFSHRQCNRPDRQSGGQVRRQIKQSHYRGVSWEENRARGQQRRKWRACTWHEGRTIHIGYFNDEMQAALAYDKTAKRLRGNKARLNFP